MRVKKSQSLDPQSEDETAIFTYDSLGRIEYILEAPIGPHKWIDPVWSISRIMYDDNGKIGMITKAPGRHSYYNKDKLQYQDGTGYGKGLNGNQNDR